MRLHIYCVMERKGLQSSLTICSREDSTSPYELFRGLKVNYKKQLRISFGDYAECHDPHNVTYNDVQTPVSTPVSHSDSN
jgi:hypothetical protein